MTTFPFYTMAPESGTITLPRELRGKPLKIVVEESAVSHGNPTREVGILSIAGILKDCRNNDIRDERYEYLMDKYANGKNTD